jgi:hypothetical protein
MTKVPRIALFILAIVICGLIFAVFFNRKNNPATQISSRASEQLELTRTALAATESLESQAAEQAWSALFEQLPQDVSVAINRALNRVLLVDSLTELTNNAILDAEAKQAARR